MNRREFVAASIAAAAAAAVPGLGRANVPKPYDWSVSPPLDKRQNYIAWMVANRGEDPKYLGLHWDRYEWMVGRGGDMWGDRNKRAFLLTPREEFCLARNLGQVYDIVGSVTGETIGTEPRTAPYFTDASVLTPAFGNPPTIILGPGEAAKAHQTDEYCLVDRIHEATAIYAALAAKWAAQ